MARRTQQLRERTTRQVFVLVWVALALTCQIETRCDAQKDNHFVIVTELTERTTKIEMSDTLLVQLISQPGTGYSWFVAGVDKAFFDYRQLSPVEYQELVGRGVLHPLSERNGPPGSEEAQVFEFNAHAKGRTKLSFDYARPWMRNSPEQRRFLNIQVVSRATSLDTTQPRQTGSQY